MNIGEVLKRPSVRRASAASALAVALYALSGFLFLPRLVLPVLVRRLSGALHREATIRALSLNPFTLSATVEGVRVRERGGDGTFLSNIPSQVEIVTHPFLEAKLNGAPVGLRGETKPFSGPRETSIEIDVKDVDLVPFSTYFGRHAGYTVGKGKLTLDLRYVINNRSLDAKNRLRVDQLELGEKVSSPDATKLPVKLAVALLRDRNGLIDLDFPVSGSLVDPKFKVGRIVLKVLGNLIVKAATSPFALLGSLFGGGQELSSSRWTTWCASPANAPPI